MVKKEILISCVLVLALVGLCAAIEKPVPKPDVVTRTALNVVTIDKAVAKPGETVAIKVSLINADTLSGAQVPIFYRSENIKLICDSVSFAGGITEKFQFHDIKIPLICEKCGTRYINPTKNPGICEKEGCGGKLSQKDQVVFFSVIDNTDPKASVPPMYPGKGLLATVYFTIPKDSPKGIVKLTRGMIPNNSVSYTFSVWNTRGDDLQGTLSDGSIEIK